MSSCFADSTDEGECAHEVKYVLWVTAQDMVRSKLSTLTSYLFVPIWQKERNPRELLGEGLLANGEGPEASDEESQSQSVGATKGQSREQQELYEVAPKGKTFPEENVDEQRETH